MPTVHKDPLGLCVSSQAIPSLSLTILSALFCGGCLVIPIRSHVPTRGASAETPDQVKLEFIKQGITTREEIVEKLAWMDTGVNEDRLFIGRWFDSNWEIGWIAASYYSSASGSSRKWNNHDLVVEFDAAGLAQEYRTLPDQKLAADLSKWAAQNQDHPLDLSAPIAVLANVNAQSEQLLLGRDFFERHALHGKGKHDFRVAPSEIASLSLSESFMLGCGWSHSGSDPDPHTLCLTFHFRPNTRAGEKLTIRADMPTVVLMFKYLAQTARPNTS